MAAIGDDGSNEKVKHTLLNLFTGEGKTKEKKEVWVI